VDEVFSDIDLVLRLYIWIVIAAAIFSWLVAFDFLRAHGPIAGMIGSFLRRITEPALRPIRRLVPNVGGVDISPILLLVIIVLVRYIIALFALFKVF
jgi:YggT family protein